MSPSKLVINKMYRLREPQTHNVRVFQYNGSREIGEYVYYFFGPLFVKESELAWPAQVQEADEFDIQYYS